MKRNKILTGVLVAVLFISMSCTKENFEPEIIRPLITLVTTDITPFSELDLTYNDNFDISVGSGPNDCPASSINFRWTDKNKEYVQIAIFCTESHEQALNLLEEFKKSHCLSYEEVNNQKDIEDIIGDQSYLDGEMFIRDNLVVRQYLSKDWTISVNQIAKSIDEKILLSQTFSSISEVKPMFTKIEFKDNPIPANTKLDFTLDAIDPNDLPLKYILRFEGLVAPEGFSIDSIVGFYNPDKADPTRSQVGLELFTYNKLGFYSDTTINLQLLK